jgi:cation diffusion facilitator CzcD-associated flavoprotein CzcO
VQVGEFVASPSSSFETANMPPFEICGRDGVDLDAWWDEHFQAYQGVSVPGFPNLFTILGPYGYNGSWYFNLIERRTFTTPLDSKSHCPAPRLVTPSAPTATTSPSYAPTCEVYAGRGRVVRSQLSSD